MPTIGATKGKKSKAAKKSIDALELRIDERRNDCAQRVLPQMIDCDSSGDRFVELLHVIHRNALKSRESEKVLPLGLQFGAEIRNDTAVVELSLERQSAT